MSFLKKIQVLSALDAEHALLEDFLSAIDSGDHKGQGGPPSSVTLRAVMSEDQRTIDLEFKKLYLRLKLDNDDYTSGTFTIHRN